MHGTGNQPAVLWILQERFARGEISESEYQQMESRLQLIIYL
ncbi:MAG TPA: hypothetical protein DDW50_07895 [Firmicutes bacterium]|nr:hypothetical protein [Bacillota bacterium]